MNYMPEIAKMLGVELYEEFNIVNCDSKYRLNDIGLQKLDVFRGQWVNCHDRFFNLLNGEYEIIKLPKPILTDKEKEDLSGIIRLFRDEVISICKFESMRHCGYEFLSIKINNNVFKYEITLPYFKKWAMYKGMKSEKEYSLEDLGL